MSKHSKKNCSRCKRNNCNRCKNITVTVRDWTPPPFPSANYDEDGNPIGRVSNEDLEMMAKAVVFPFAAVGVFGCELGKAALNGAKSLHRAVKHRYNPWTYEPWDHK